MAELGDDTFEEDPLFGQSDEEIEQEAIKFDKKGKKKSPLVIEISDDERAKQKGKGAKTGKKTLNVKQPPAASKVQRKKAAAKQVKF